MKKLGGSVAKAGQTLLQWMQSSITGNPESDPLLLIKYEISWDLLTEDTLFRALYSNVSEFNLFLLILYINIFIYFNLVWKIHCN